VQILESQAKNSLLRPKYIERRDLLRWPERLAQQDFYPVAYRWMLLSRRLEQRLAELFQKGRVKGTVTISIGNEATTVGMAMPYRPGQDVISLLHRDFASHLLLGATPYQLMCQYMANAESPTHGFEGNVHHGSAATRRFPMISHLGKMLSLVVGGTWAARRQGEAVFGLAVIGDGGTSTGEFHESLNLASVHRVPVLFLIENNHYAFSTPTSAQYHCQRLSDRAAGYGISGRTVDGTDPWAVYSAVCDALDAMAAERAPAVLECMSLRLGGHAVYDKALYVPAQVMDQWRHADPLVHTRRRLEEFCGLSPATIAAMEASVEETVRQATERALRVPRPTPPRQWPVYADTTPRPVGESAHARSMVAPFGQEESEEWELGDEQSDLDDTDSALGLRPIIPCGRRTRDRRDLRAAPFQARGVKNGDAVRLALDHILAGDPTAFVAGMDIGVYGSAFKTCKGLIDRYGAERVIDMPMCESALVGFVLGASQTGARPVFEFQFADFSTEAVTQLGLNAGTWHFRTGRGAPILFRLPCGGGLTMGAFHSGEFEGLWSRFPGLKLLYPATPQETFEALVAGFHDPNPCLVLEHKLLYWSRPGDIDFDGDLAAVWRPRRYNEGSELTLVALGAMVHESLAAAADFDGSVEVWNPMVLQPLDLGPICESVEKTGRLLVVQEAGETQGLGDRLISLITQQCFAALKCSPRLIAAPDVPVPFAPELESCCRPSLDRIAAEIGDMVDESRLMIRRAA
jgi:2-oxoisovalerate dehydrogenase E1 component